MVKPIFVDICQKSNLARIGLLIFELDDGLINPSSEKVNTLEGYDNYRQIARIICFQTLL